MGGLLAKNSPAMALPGSQQVQGSLETATHQVQGSLGTSTQQGSKPKKKICCACPETKMLRDECIVEHGEEACAKWIDAHRQCLRAEGFNI